MARRSARGSNVSKAKKKAMKASIAESNFRRRQMDFHAPLENAVAADAADVADKTPQPVLPQDPFMGVATPLQYLLRAVSEALKNEPSPLQPFPAEEALFPALFPALTEEEIASFPELTVADMFTVLSSLERDITAFHLSGGIGAETQ